MKNPQKCCINDTYMTLDWWGSRGWRWTYDGMLLERQRTEASVHGMRQGV